MIDLPKGEFGALDCLEIGKAAEHIVCADLILSGYRAFLSDQGLPYDIVVDLNGKFIRIQVKATLRAKNANARGRCPNLVYVFYARRRGKKGKGSRLSNKDCDIVALVGLDKRSIAYFPLSEMGQTISLYPTGYKFPGLFKRSRYASIDGFPFAGALSRCL